MCLHKTLLSFLPQGPQGFQGGPGEAGEPGPAVSITISPRMRSVFYHKNKS